MSETISKNDIRFLYGIELQNAIMAVPLQKWVHNPPDPDQIEFTHCKGAYGLASNKGGLWINALFIGTSAHQKLIQTIRHELAHLIAGVDRRHGPVWRHWFEVLGGHELEEIAAEQARQVVAKVTYKWSLVAHFVHGRSAVVGQYHRRDKKKMNAKPNQYSVDMDGERRSVIRFEYIENK